VPKGWVNSRDVKKRLGLQKSDSIYSPSSILVKSGVLDDCCSLLGLQHSDLYYNPTTSLTYLHPLAEAVYARMCLYKHEGHRVGNANKDGILSEIVQPYLNLFQGSPAQAEVMQERDPVVTVEAEVVEEPEEETKDPGTRIQLQREDYQRADGFVNATKLCQSGGKEWGHYRENGRTQRYLETLSRSIGIPIDVLINTKTVGSNEDRGTWVHPRIATHLAQWISVEFEVQVNAWLVELHTTGRVEMDSKGSHAPRQLPPTDVRISEFKTSLEWLGIDSKNPRYAPFVRDCAANILMGHNRPALEGDRDIPLGVAEIAERCGYPSMEVQKVRSPLGRYVSAEAEKPGSKIRRLEQKDDRIINGTQRPVWLYVDDEAVREVIRKYMDSQRNRRNPRKPPKTQNTKPRRPKGPSPSGGNVVEMPNLWD
jgi:hypothetical protein